jgi:hypothetical protein
MGFFNRLLGREPASAPSEHAVLVKLKLSGDGFGAAGDVASVHELSTKLKQCIDRAGSGEFDGDEFGGGECTLFMYGPNADRLFSAIEPTLRASPLAAGAVVIKRYGKPTDLQVKSVRITL